REVHHPRARGRLAQHGELLVGELLQHELGLAGLQVTPGETLLAVERLQHLEAEDVVVPGDRAFELGDAETGDGLPNGHRRASYSAGVPSMPSSWWRFSASISGVRASSTRRR